MKKRVTITFAGISFSGFEHRPTHITVPKPAFVKILRTGTIRLDRDYSYTDDYAGDNAASFHQKANLDGAAFLEDPFHKYMLLGKGQPALLYCDPEAGTITYMPHMNTSYTVREARQTQQPQPRKDRSIGQHCQSILVERCMPYRILMSCGHIELRMMRPALAGFPWNDEHEPIRAGAGCDRCDPSKRAMRGLPREIAPEDLGYCIFADGKPAQAIIYAPEDPNRVERPAAFVCSDHVHNTVKDTLTGRYYAPKGQTGERWREDAA